MLVGPVSSGYNMAVMDSVADRDAGLRVGREEAIHRAASAAPFVAPALAILCADKCAAVAVVYRRFVLPVSRRPSDEAASLSRDRQLCRPDDRSRRLGAFPQHRVYDRCQRGDANRGRRAARFRLLPPVSRTTGGADARPDPDAAFDGRSRHFLQPLLRSYVRHRERVCPPVHRRAVRPARHALLSAG